MPNSEVKDVIHRIGRLVSIFTQENFDAVHDMILENRQIWAETYLRENVSVFLGMRKLCTY